MGVLVLAAFGPGRPAEIFAQQAEEQGEAATPEYNAAVKLQNKGEYKLAAEQWADFISKHPDRSPLRSRLPLPGRLPLAVQPIGLGPAVLRDGHQELSQARPAGGHRTCTWG